jgi:ESCRT-II complex subunit VPS36
MRTFASGLSVLHTPPYTHAAFGARMAGLLLLGGPKTTMEIAQEEGITVGLAGEMIAAMEEDESVWRDDGSVAIGGGGSGSGVEVKWWINILKGYVWDGQE